MRKYALPLAGLLLIPAAAIADEINPSDLGLTGNEYAQARPATASQQMQKFMVFFDWDKSVLTTEAKRIIANAAEDFRRTGATRIVATGHTDTSGSPAYNQKLSERRAQAVKAELVRLGVPAGVITTVGRGQGDLLVPTKDNVREAQNRRVEIEIPVAPPPPRPVVQAPPPAAPAPKKPVWGPVAGDWSISGGPSVGIYGDGFSKGSIGGTLQGGYWVTDNFEVGIRQSLLAKKFYGSSRLFGEYNFRVSDSFLPYIGIIAGGVYGTAVDDGVGVGPSIGFKYYAWPKTFIDVGADYMFVVSQLGKVKNQSNIIPRIGIGYNF